MTELGLVAWRSGEEGPYRLPATHLVARVSSVRGGRRARAPRRHRPIPWCDAAGSLRDGRSRAPRPLVARCADRPDRRAGDRLPAPAGRWRVSPYRITTSLEVLEGVDQYEVVQNQGLVRRRVHSHRCGRRGANFRAGEAGSEPRLRRGPAARGKSYGCAGRHRAKAAPGTLPCGRKGLRILSLTYEYPPIGGGGGRVAAALNEELARRGDRVEVLTSRMRGFASEERIGAVTVHRSACLRRDAHYTTAFELSTTLLPAWREACRLMETVPARPRAYALRFALGGDRMAARAPLPGALYHHGAWLGHPRLQPRPLRDTASVVEAVLAADHGERRAARVAVGVPRGIDPRRKSICRSA